MQREWYRDGGCCGCNKRKRRITLIIIGIICIIVGILLYFNLDDPEQQKYQGGGMGGFGLIFILSGICCPNFCCYGRGNNNNYNRV